MATATIDESEFRLKKLAVYEGIIKSTFDQLAAGGQMTKEANAKFVGLTTTGLLIYGSDAVISAFLEFKASTGSPNLMNAIAKLFIAMRADLGHGNKNITPENVLAMFIAKTQ